MPVSLAKQCRSWLHRIDEPSRQCIKPIGHNFTDVDDPHRSADGLVWSLTELSTREATHV